MRQEGRKKISGTQEKKSQIKITHLARAFYSAQQSLSFRIYGDFLRKTSN